MQFLVLTALLLVPIGLATGQAQQRNHAIKFIDMRNEYEFNATKAREALESNLRQVTGYSNINIEEISDKSTSWSVDEINALPGCPEKEIIGLMSLIKKDDEYTRRFKMVMEDFDRPRGVQLEWLGACDYMGRKRSQLIGGDSGEIHSNSVAIELTSSTTELISTTSVEPTEPVTVTEQASTIDPTFETTTTATESDGNDTNLTLDPLSESFFDSPFNDTPIVEWRPIEQTSSTTEMIPTTSVQPTESVTVIKLASTINPIMLETTTRLTTAMESDENDTNVTLASSNNLLGSLFNGTHVETPDSTGRGFNIETIENIIAEDPSGETDPDYDDSKGNYEGPYYGKYIGLGMGFLIFVAYLVCCRSSRRQGTYEVQAD